MRQKEVRENRVNLRLSKSEYEILKKKADGMQLAKFLRAWIIEGKPQRRERDLPKINPEFMRKITSISNNVNQLVRYTHSQVKENKAIDLINLAMQIQEMKNEIKELKEKYTVQDDS